jgi:transposase-like protein
MKYDERRTDHEKLLILRDYCESGISRSELVAKYKIRGGSQLMDWMRKLVDPNCKRLLDMKGKRIDISHSDVNQNDLEREVLRLRQELERERLLTEALNLLIDEAEKSYKIPIRKKTGAK